jgi:hypothetical protein
LAPALRARNFRFTVFRPAIVELAGVTHCFCRPAKIDPACKKLINFHVLTVLVSQAGEKLINFFCFPTVYFRTMCWRKRAWWL